MNVGVDSYSYHRLYGEIYPNQVDPGQRWEFDRCIDDVVRMGADGISLETCFMPRFDDEYLTGIKAKPDEVQAVEDAVNFLKTNFGDL